MSRYFFIDAHASTCAVRDLCWMLWVSRGGYYQWQVAGPPPVPAWQLAAQQAFTRHARRYGMRRLRAELQSGGHRVGRYALRVWLRASGQQAISTRPAGRPRTTQAAPAAVIVKTGYRASLPPRPKSGLGW